MVWPLVIAALAHPAVRAGLVSVAQRALGGKNIPGASFAQNQAQTLSWQQSPQQLSSTLMSQTPGRLYGAGRRVREYVKRVRRSRRAPARRRKK